MSAHVMTTILNVFSTRRPLTIYSAGLALLLVLGWLDYLTGEYSLIIFYLIPVSLVAWFVGKRSGLFFCVLAFITRIIADGAVGGFSFHYSTLHYWNLFVEFVFLLIMSRLLSALKKSLARGRATETGEPPA